MFTLFSRKATVTLRVFTQAPALTSLAASSTGPKRSWPRAEWLTCWEMQLDRPCATENITSHMTSHMTSHSKKKVLTTANLKPEVPSSSQNLPVSASDLLNKMQPTNPNAHTYVSGTDAETHGYAVTQNTFLKQFNSLVLCIFPLLPYQCTVDCGIWKKVACKVWSVECRVWSVRYGM